MIKHKSVIWSVRNTTLQDWYESFVWVLYILVGSLAPVYISVLILLIAGQSFYFLDFTRHAEFAIYSASILAASAYLIFKDKKRPFPRRGIFGALIIFGLITSTALFASVTIFTKIAIISKFLAVDESLVKSFSLYLYMASICIAFFVNVLDSVIPSEDVRAIESEQQENLYKAFKDLGGQDEQS